MPVAHTPSTLGRGFNNTLAISSALALPGRVTARRYTAIRPHWLELVICVGGALVSTILPACCAGR